MQGWLRPKDVSAFCNVGERTVWKWLNRGLHHSKIRGITLIKVDDLNNFLESFRVSENKIDQIVDEVLGEFFGVKKT